MMKVLCSSGLKAKVLTVSFLVLFFSVCAARAAIQLTPIGTYESGIFADGGAEIVTYDKDSARLFVVNGADATIDVLDISDPTLPNRIFQIDVSPYGKQANSVSSYGGVIVAAVENVDKQANGRAVFFDSDGNYLNDVEVGALPDMILFTPDGKYVLVANEGEPSDDYTVDPEGTVSIINLKHRDPEDITQDNVATADFTAFNDAVLDPSIRIFGPGASVAEDLEPEFITVAKKRGRWTAYVVLQENNALAKIDVKSATVTRLTGLGFKDHSLPGNGFDASNKDGAINITERPTYGMYQPDAITSYKVRGRTYLVMANEGDSRDYEGFSEEERVKDLLLDPVAFPDAATLQQEENLGRLKTTTTMGDFDGDGFYEELYSYGARSFSIRKPNGRLVFDSGDELEHLTALGMPDDFNSDDEENDSFDDRSDDKGPEPEGVVVGKVRGRYYAFVGLERIGGIMVYDVTKPNKSFFVYYTNTRDFSGDPPAGTAGDMSPEGLLFIKKKDSPNGKPLLVVAFEVSGTTTIFQIDRDKDDKDDADDDD